MATPFLKWKVRSSLNPSSQLHRDFIANSIRLQLQEPGKPATAALWSPAPFNQQLPLQRCPGCQVMVVSAMLGLSACPFVRSTFSLAVPMLAPLLLTIWASPLPLSTSFIEPIPRPVPRLACTL
ncbi:hypothetical protein ASPSYDRAFT_281438 [Aspergillus sydowii CBS 593.65]|uniref:Uncharacterized protein n=1 Tax=Aspergillus sydowii CBS 593.65 TaxID=1036612 RepID=A0A1L9TX65_9EURO|nr:uncharacterized protein ASPSYDRAFT_281438 [Aspergillus sydowii CBS 593.65]OJJ63995.1 hypothetical protein ASPSYDRAFT_281438 [Aspergillus sydowii CBS 593.65]